MPSKKEIIDLADIHLLVDDFYSQARKDDLLGEIFDKFIQDNWDAHLEKMYRFWQTLLLDEHSYSGNPFPPHIQMPLQEKHFQRWQELFIQTVDRHFHGLVAQQAKWRASKMAQVFQTKLSSIRQLEATP